MFHGKFTIVLWNYMVVCNGALIPIQNRQGKLSLLEWTNYNYHEPEGQGTYAFGYDVEDPDTNNIQFRNEEKLSNGSVVGSYGYLESSGNAFMVRYIADQEGYRAIVENSVKLNFLKPVVSSIGFRNAENSSYNTKTGQHMIYINSRNVKHEESLSDPRTPISILDRDANHGQIVQYQNKNEQNDFKQKSTPFLQFKNIQTSLNSERNGKTQQSSTQKYPDPNFSSEEESNAFYYPQNILESPDFHKKRDDKDKIVFPKNDRVGKELLRELDEYPIRNLSQNRVTLSTLINGLIPQKTNEIRVTWGNHELDNNGEKESKEQNEHNSTFKGDLLKFRRNSHYPLAADFSPSVKTNQKFNASQQRKILFSNGYVNEHFKKYNRSKRTPRGTEISVRILTPDVNNPPSPSQVVSSCTGLQSSNNSNRFSKSTILHKTFTQTNREPEQLKNGQRILRILTPDHNVFPPPTLKPCREG